MKLTSLLLASAFLLVSCKEKQGTEPSVALPSAPTQSEYLQAVLATPPKGEASSIHVVKSSSKPGDDVTIKGRIMGNSNPFVAGRSVFILGDPEIISACNDKEGDDCKTPWDACCNTPEEKKMAIATIQIVDAFDRVLKEPVEGVGGLSKLATVTVSGKVAEGSSADLLIVNATAVQAGK